MLLSGVLLACTPAAAFFEGKQPTSLLEDRLTLWLPGHSRIDPRPHDLMGAPPSPEEETRAMLEAGDERLVIMAFELFARGGADPDRSVRAAVAARFHPPPLKIEPFPLSDPSLKAWAVFPASIDRNLPISLVFSVFVLHPDGFMQILQFYVNPPAASGTGCSGLARAAGAGKLPEMPGELPTCTALAHAIASTLGVGPRHLDVGGGERKLTGRYGVDSFSVKVPAGTSNTAQTGHDFTVHRVRLPVDLGEPQPLLGIYVGRHPSYHYAPADADVSPTLKPGQIFGKAVSWRVWTRSSEGVIAEVILEHPKSQNIQIHLFARAADEKALAPLLDAAASLRLP